MSLIVAIPKSGFGNSNDGNTARKAFMCAETFSSITGVSLELITRLKNILIAVCSGYELNIKTFSSYCSETSEYILQEYDWYTIPPSVHKLLEHSSLIAQTLQLPIGYYSEEPLEAQNKHLRNACLNHTCKVSRLNTMTNHYNYMLTRTDLVVSSISFVKHKL